MPLIIDDLHAPLPPPPGLGMGLALRDFARLPVGCYAAAPAWNLPLWTDAQIQEAIALQAEHRSSLWHIREAGDGGRRIPSLDQNGQGYCWAYSTTACIMILRVAAGMPYVRLSGHMVGCLVKSYRDEGGWNAQSAEFTAKHGVASTEHWPEKSMARTNDTPTMRENARLHLNFEYLELTDGPDQARQMATAYGMGFALMKDQQHWMHSVMGIQLVAWTPGARFPLRDKILNSWTDGWGEDGCAEQADSKALAQGCIAIRAVSPSVT